MNGEKHNKEYRWQMTMPKLEWSHSFENTMWEKQQKVDENMKTLQNKKDGMESNYESMRVVKRQKGGKKNGMTQIWTQWLQVAN